MQPRKPTKKEKRELLNYYIFEEAFGLGTISEDEVKQIFYTWINEAPVAVFDQYHTDDAKHKGKALVILPTNDLSPERVEIFLWYDGTITKIENKERR